MNLQKRIEELEHRIGVNEDFLLIVITFLTPEEKVASGADKRLVGYCSIGRDDRKWFRQPGQSVADLKAAVERELREEGHKVYAVSECYPEDGDGGRTLYKRPHEHPE